MISTRPTSDAFRFVDVAFWALAYVGGPQPMTPVYLVKRTYSDYQNDKDVSSWGNLPHTKNYLISGFIWF